MFLVSRSPVRAEERAEGERATGSWENSILEITLTPILLVLIHCKNL